MLWVWASQHFPLVGYLCFHALSYLLVPHLLQMRQLLVCVVVPLYLCIFSGRGSLSCGYHSILPILLCVHSSTQLFLHFLWIEQPCFQVLQCFVSSALSPDGWNSYVCTTQWLHAAVPCHTYWIDLSVEGPIVCMLWCLLFLARSSIESGGPQGCPENLERVPTC